MYIRRPTLETKIANIDSINVLGVKSYDGWKIDNFKIFVRIKIRFLMQMLGFNRILESLAFSIIFTGWLFMTSSFSF